MMSSSTVSRYRESSTVSSPTKIYDQNNTSFTEEYALDIIAKEAELRLQHQREQNREARQIRYKELEKNVQNENEDEDSPTIPLSSSTKIKNEISSQSGIMITNSLLLQKFLNGDIDLRSIEQRDLRRLLSELESKYKSLMITNSSIYNEKQALYYQLDTYKDIINEHYEISNQAKRQLKDKCRDFDLQKQILIDSEQNNNQLKTILTNCKKLIDEEEKQEGQEIFFTNQSIHDKLKRILNDKYQQYQQIIKLKTDLDEEKNRLKIFKEQIPNSIDLHHQNLNDNCDSEQQKQLMKEINDLKNRLQKFEADNVSLQQENKRYEAQLTRHKQQLDDAEHVENELKQERRRLQKELRIARDELENERTRSDILQRENTRLRTLRKKNLLNTTDDDLVISTSHSPLLTNNFNDIQSNSPLEDSI